MRTSNSVFAKAGQGAATRLLGTGRTLALAAGLALAAPLAVGPTEARSAPDSFADIAEALTPAVVHISTTQSVQLRRPGMDELDDLFRDLLPPGQTKRTALGSGFVIDPSGIIVTNNHVIENADEIVVTLDDDQKLPATLLGTDAYTDIAVLKVDAKRPLPYVKWANSDTVRVGDWVVAIGNPFDLGGTVTAGIISARNRDIGGRYDDYIQTDASINRGNSGGPLFDMDGDVVGVNTAIFSQTGGSIGIGFAVPSNLAKRIVDQILEYGQTRRGYLGVGIQELTPEIAEIAGLDRPRGAMVTSTEDDSPARKAGLQRGDIILEFNGQTVTDHKALVRIVADTPIGKEVDVKVLRDGKPVTLKVVVGELQEERVSAIERGENPLLPSSGEEGYGMELSRITPELRQRFNLGREVNGVLVTDVDPESAVANDVQPGDVIVEVARKPVQSPDEVFKFIREQTGGEENKPVLMLLDRNGRMQFVGVRVENSRND